MNDLVKKRYEMPLEYIERVLEEVVQNLKLSGATIVCTSNRGRKFIVPYGEAPAVQIFDTQVAYEESENDVLQDFEYGKEG